MMDCFSPWGPEPSAAGRPSMDANDDDDDEDDDSPEPFCPVLDKHSMQEDQ